MHHIALTAAIVLLALQKPSQGSKAKDHQECLSRRLALWKEGEIDNTPTRRANVTKAPHKASKKCSVGGSDKFRSSVP